MHWNAARCTTPLAHTGSIFAVPVDTALVARTRGALAVCSRRVPRAPLQGAGPLVATRDLQAPAAAMRAGGDACLNTSLASCAKDVASEYIARMKTTYDDRSRSEENFSAFLLRRTLSSSSLLVYTDAWP